MYSIIGFLILLALERIGRLQFEPQRLLRPYIQVDAAYFLQRSALGLAVGAFYVFLFSQPFFTYHPRAELHPLAVFVVSFCGFDFAKFFTHWLLHKSHAGWKLHQIHHSVLDLDTAAGFRGHVLAEIAYSVVHLLFLYLFIFQFSWPAKTVAAALILSNFWNVFNHCNLKLRGPGGLSRALETVFILPGTHRLHHMGIYFNRNYGTTLTIWDRMWGTYQAPEQARATPIGFPAEQGFPQSYLRQLVYPFRRG